MKSKAKIVVFCCGTAIILTTGIFTAMAVTDNLHKEKENNFVPAVISLAVVENEDNNSSYKNVKELEWKKEDGENKYTAEKKVEIANLNNKDENNTSAYIRVCINPRWTAEVTINAGAEDESKVTVDADMPLDDFGALTDIYIQSNSYTMGDVTFQLADDWSNHWFYNNKDGYFYCISAVAFGKKTPPLLDSVTISSDTKEKLDLFGVKLTVDVLADGIQSEGKAANTMWKNVKINTNNKLEKKE